MSQSPQIKIDHAILCDDVRQENNGKLILIGVYSTDILVHHFPSTLNLSLFLHGSVQANGNASIKVRYRVDFDDEDLTRYEATASGELSVAKSDDSDEIVVPLPKVPIECRGSGSLQIHYRIDDSRWKPLLSRWIKPIPTAS